MTTNVYRVFIKADAERVWEAITDPEWNDKYAYRARSNYDLRPGGAYVVDATRRDGRARRTRRDHRRRGARVRPADPAGADLARVLHPELRPSRRPVSRGSCDEVGNGMTELTVTHELENAPVTAAITSGQVQDAGGGFAWILSDLKTLLETGRAMGS